MSFDFASRLRRSVIAVPPLARNAALQVDREQNARLIRHLEAGGISTLLYGGNALFYHIRLSEYADTLTMLREASHRETWILPSLGPAYGMMMDQAAILADMPFDTAMILPQKEIADEAGIATGIRHVAERMGKPIVVYLKFDRWLSPSSIEKLHRDGLISWVKYAVVREDASNDPYLKELMEVMPKELVISGMGEQPAITHLREFGLGGFTSGCVCIHPTLTARMLRAMQRQEWDIAETCRKRFAPLEALRDAISPIRVLHTAVQCSGIAEVGPMPPLVSPLDEAQCEEISRAVSGLRQSLEPTDEAKTPGTGVC